MANAVGSRFEIKEEGFFVVMTQSTFRLNYRSIDWGKKPLPGYENDEKRLIERFKLSGENHWIGRDLTNDSEGEDGMKNEKIVERASFNQFMEWVCDDIKKQKPKFVMFFLMSHGFKDGKFLLASQGRQINESTPTSKTSCCILSHTSSGDCFTRDLVEDVIKPVSEAVGVEVPKVFIIQACRGEGATAVPAGSADPEVKRDGDPASETELFFSDCPNTLVFRASVEYQASMVSRPGSSPSLNGSVFIQSFCDSLDELQKAYKQYGKLQRKLADSEQLTKYLASPGCRENVIGGWIMNVCQRTSALAANWMLEKAVVPAHEPRNVISNSDKELTPELKAGFQLVMETIKNALSMYNTPLNCSEDIEQVSLWCTTNEKIFGVQEYFRTNVVRATDNYSLPKNTSDSRCQEIKAPLGRIAIAMLKFKQQPHVSSSLSKKLSFIEILQTQNALETTPDGTPRSCVFF